MAAPEERELSAEQTEKLLQFQDLTGIESMDQCRHTLEQHNWNIEAAVQDRLNEQEGVPSVFNPPPSRPLQVNTADHRIYSYVVSRPQPRASSITEISLTREACVLCGQFYETIKQLQGRYFPASFLGNGEHRWYREWELLFYNRLCDYFCCAVVKTKSRTAKEDDT